MEPDKTPEDNIKKMQHRINQCCCIIIAICGFVLTTCKTTLKIDLGYWEFVPTTITSIVLCIQARSAVIARVITKTQVIMNDVSRQEFTDLNTKLNDLITMNSELLSQTDMNEDVRSIVSKYREIKLPQIVNIPIQPYEDARMIKKLPETPVPTTNNVTYQNGSYTISFDTPRF